MPPYVYFTSYARIDDNEYSRLGDVMGELRERVRALLGAPDAAKVGFIDGTSISTGEQWEERISEAVHEARVLVCFLSPSYFNSPWCAGEFAVFRRRIETMPAATGKPAVIIPVLWELGPLPRGVGAFQYKEDRFPELYVKEGLSSLKRVKRGRNAYKTTIDVLAQVIRDAAQLALPPLSPHLRFADLPRSFDNPGPYGAAVAVIHPAGPQWAIGLPGWTVARSVDDVAAAQRIPWQELLVAPDLPARLATAAAARAVPVVIVCAKSAKTGAHAAIVEQLDASSAAPMAILVGTTDLSADDTLARALLPRLAGSGRHSIASFSIDDTNAFANKLGRMIAKLRMAYIDADTPARVDDQGLTTAAELSGISIATRPSLQGPRGAAAASTGAAA